MFNLVSSEGDIRKISCDSMPSRQLVMISTNVRETEKEPTQLEFAGHGHGDSCFGTCEASTSQALLVLTAPGRQAHPVLLNFSFHLCSVLLGFALPVLR